MLDSKQLAQLRPSTTGAEVFYSLPLSKKAILTTLTICNTSGSSADFSFYHDNDGTTYNETTALFYQVTVASKETISLNTKVCANNSSGRIAVQSSVSNALTFTAYGVEYD